jgi:2-amino-4-hydroxy-6-hydroxymethyldihydropteridine diphosphokinase
MKQRLNDKLTLFFKPKFPKKRVKSSAKKYKVTIGIGGNIGNVKRRFDKLLLSLEQNSHFDVLATSPLLQNPPFGYLNQDDFINGIVVLKTNLSVNSFFKSMQRLENRYGRKRSFQDAPRTLDIDIIFFDYKKINTKKLTIPHKDWANRESVIIPLKRIKLR